MPDTSDDESPAPQMQPPGELDNKELPSLFWDTIPENAEEHPDWLAMQALREEATPEERAETFKVNGNNKLKIGLKAKNKHVLREAVDFYTKGLAEKCQNAKLNAVLCCNRAHVQSLLGNWRSALEDAQLAQALDPTYVKAYFRSARAALKLGKHEVCLKLIGQGRQYDPTAKEFLEMEQEAKAALSKAQAEAQREAAAREAVMAPARALAAAIARRKYQLTLPQVRTRHSWRPSLDAETDQLSWPCVILYPEAGSEDEIQAWEEQETVAAQLDQMFGPEAPPLEWDTQHQYTRSNVELYYMSWAGKPLTQSQLLEALATGNWPTAAHEGGGPARYGERASRWVRVKEAWSLHDVLSQPDFIIPGVPIFAAVAKGTEFRERLLSKNRE